MTALVGVFGQGAASAESSLGAMLGAMRHLGTEVPERYSAGGAILASRRHPWEVHEHGWSGPAITVQEDWVVAADASIYYLADLRRKLPPRHSVAKDAATGELVVAALRTWGDGFANHLEGDFAIVALHRPSGRVLLARDFAGRRSLTLSVTSDRTLVVASAARSVVEFPGVGRGFNLDFIATSITGVHGHGSQTAFADVVAVPGGVTFAFDGGRLTAVQRWTPPPFSSEWVTDVSDRAADELRGLIEDAVVERLPERGTAAVFMSGGWDSTSLYAAGRNALERSRNRSLVLWPVSLRYPEGDTGNETAYIEAIARRWATDVRWVSVDEIPLFSDSERRAGVRDDPRVQPFESQVRALCGACRELGVRVVEDGAGGDHLFMVSSAAILADHLRAGRLDQLWPAWRAWGHRMVRTFARACLLPQFSHEMLTWIGTIRGRPLKGFWERDLPPWVRATEGLRRQMVPEFDQDPTEGIAAYETRSLLTTPLVSRAMSWNHAIALEEGILLRSPMFDQRVMQFAASRPLNERHGGPDSKVLLRRSMRDLLPPEVLEPRGRKTGTPAGYFQREMRASACIEYEHLFGGKQSNLEAMGLIRADRLRAAVDEYVKTGSHALGASLQLTIEAERWLAAQFRRG